MKQSEKNQKSRALILTHAFAEFASHGYEGSSLNQICARGNLSKGLLYHCLLYTSSMCKQTLQRMENAAGDEPAAFIVLIIPFRFILQHCTGGCVDFVAILHAAGFELYLIMGDALIQFSFHRQVVYVVGRNARMLERCSPGHLDTCLLYTSRCV